MIRRAQCAWIHSSARSSQIRFQSRMHFANQDSGWTGKHKRRQRRVLSCTTSKMRTAEFRIWRQVCHIGRLSRSFHEPNRLFVMWFSLCETSRLGQRTGVSLYLSDKILLVLSFILSASACLYNRQMIWRCVFKDISSVYRMGFRVCVRAEHSFTRSFYCSSVIFFLFDFEYIESFIFAVVQPIESHTSFFCVSICFV
jgi:hypothetical protein